MSFGPSLTQDKPYGPIQNRKGEGEEDVTPVLRLFEIILKGPNLGFNNEIIVLFETSRATFYS